MLLEEVVIIYYIYIAETYSIIDTSTRLVCIQPYGKSSDYSLYDIHLNMYSTIVLHIA